MALLEYDDDEIWFDYCGSGSPVLLVPGLSGSAHFFDAHLDAFARRHLVVTHDHRGTHRSGRKRMDYSIAQMAGDVVAVADHLGLEQFHYVGHSTGGAIGQHLAVHHPERLRSVVLSATWAGQDSYFQSLFTLRRDVLRDMGLKAYKQIASLMLKPPQYFAATASANKSDTATDSTKPEDAHIALSRVQALLDFDLRERLGDITAPCLVICARDDMVTPPHCSEELLRGIDGAASCWVESGGHFYVEVNPDEFRKPVLAFIDAHDAD